MTDRLVKIIIDFMLYAVIVGSAVAVFLILYDVTCRDGKYLGSLATPSNLQYRINILEQRVDQLEQRR